MLARLPKYYPPDEWSYSSQNLDAISGGYKGGARRGAIVAAEEALVGYPQAAPVTAESIGTSDLTFYQRFLGIFPSLAGASALLAISWVAVVAFSFVLPTVIGDLDPGVGTPNSVDWVLRNALDPTLLHVIGIALVAVLLAKIGRPKGATFLQAVTIAVISVGLVLLLQYVLDLLALKPGIGVDRPAGHDSEPPTIRIAHSLFGGGEDFPSGTVARQTALACFVFWFASSSSLRLSLVARCSIIGFAWILVALVAVQRVYTEAHSVEAVLVGVSFGILTSWTIAALVAAPIQRHARSLMRSVFQLWIIVLAGWLILADERLPLMLVLVVVLALFSLWSVFVEPISGAALTPRGRQDWFVGPRKPAGRLRASIRN